MTPVDSSHPEIAEGEPAWLAVVREQVERLSFGTVQITVHNGRVTQVDATIRTRFEAGNVSVVPSTRRTLAQA